MKSNSKTLAEYTAQARCGKELTYYINLEMGTISVSSNPICVMHYMLGCRECPWVKSQHDHIEDIARIDYHKSRT